MTNVWCVRAEFGTYVRLFRVGKPGSMPLEVCVSRPVPDGYDSWVAKRRWSCQ